VKRIRVNIKGRTYTVEIGEFRRKTVDVLVDGQHYVVEMDVDRSGESASAKPPPTKRKEAAGLRGITQEDELIIRCPMPGRIVAVSLTAGDAIKSGDELCVLETMKMEQSVRSSHEGTVKEVHVTSGDNVQAGSPIIQLEG
jgi:biotin carboxyl carrier protein